MEGQNHPALSSRLMAALSTMLLLLAGCASTEPRSTQESAAKRAALAAATKSSATPVVPANPTRPVTERPPFKEVLQAAAAKPSAPFEGEGWVSLFDGKTLKGWKPTDFAGHGNVECQLGMIILETGDPFTGLNWTDSVPRIN